MIWWMCSWYFFDVFMVTVGGDLFPASVSMHIYLSKKQHWKYSLSRTRRRRESQGAIAINCKLLTFASSLRFKSLHDAHFFLQATIQQRCRPCSAHSLAALEAPRSSDRGRPWDRLLIASADLWARRAGMMPSLLPRWQRFIWKMDLHLLGEVLVVMKVLMERWEDN